MRKWSKIIKYVTESGNRSPKLTTDPYDKECDTAVKIIQMLPAKF